MLLNYYFFVLQEVSWTVYADLWAIHPKISGDSADGESRHQEIQALYEVKTTFAVIYLCLLFTAGLNFSMKYVSYDSLKIYVFLGIYFIQFCNN